MKLINQQQGCSFKVEVAKWVGVSGAGASLFEVIAKIGVNLKTTCLHVKGYSKCSIHFSVCPDYLQGSDNQGSSRYKLSIARQRRRN